MSRRASAVFGVGLAVCGPAAAQSVTNANTGTVYNTLTEAVGASLAGHEIVIGAGLRSEADTVHVPHDLTLRGAGNTLTTVQVTSGTALTALEVAAGAGLVVRDLELVSTGLDQGAILGVGANDLVIEDAAIAITYGSDGAVTLYDPTSLVMSRVVLTGAGGVGPLAVVGTVSAPVVLEDVAFVDTNGEDIASAIVAVGVDLRCTRCTFERVSGGGAIFLEGGTTTFEQSRFCDVEGIAIGGRGTGSISNTLFASGDTALSVDDGAWTLVNNSFLELTGPAVVDVEGTASIVSTNDLFSGNTGTAIRLAVPSAPLVTHGWFDGNGAVTEGYNGAFPGSNHVEEGDPGLVAWPGDCASATIYPTPLTSPLLDVGDPGIVDIDGSRSDIGHAGGPGAVRSVIANDTDGDGATFLHDCNDSEPRSFPGNPEVCDHVDNSCDGTVDEADPAIDPALLPSWTPDCDGDGEGASDATPVVACFEPHTAPPCPFPIVGVWLSSFVVGPLAGSDCNDGNPSIGSGADELCSAGDQDCDGDPDLGAIDPTAFYVDTDGDGYGDGAAQLACSAPPGTTAAPGDCDETDPAVHPGVPDACGDGVDQDCGGADGDPTNGLPWYVDADGDGFGDANAVPVYSCAAPGAGYTEAVLALDCDDTAAAVNPDAVEQCNTFDDDCDTEIDELPPATWYPDSDGDGFGDSTLAETHTCPPSGFLTVAGDCDDRDDSRNPAATERCNEVDDNCDGFVDNGREVVVWYRDADGDGHGDPATGAASLCPSDPTGWVTTKDDCDDADPAVWECPEPVPSKPVREVEKGCGCASAPSPAPALVFLLALILRRRR